MNSFLNVANLQSKWNEKAKNPCLEETEIIGNSTKNAGILQQIEQLQESRLQDRAGQLYSKLQMGYDLSPPELEYLRSISPDLYNSAIRTMAERKAYEEALRQCETKDDVMSLHMGKIASVMTQVKDAMARNDLPACIAANNRMNILSKVMTDYSVTADYKNLASSHSELHEAREALRKEIKGEHDEDDVEETTTDKEASETAQKTENAETAEPDLREVADGSVNSKEKPMRWEPATKKKQVDPELVKKAKPKPKSTPVARLYASFLQFASANTSFYTEKA